MPEQPSEAEEGGTHKQWQGYSDYESVAARLHQDINRAVDAYSHLDSRATQHIGITPQTAVETRAAILKITKRLAKEVERQDHREPFDEIHERWSGDDGYLKRLERVDFYEDGVPGWLGELIDDVVEAGWELGYLKAGRTKQEASGDDDLAEVKEMFK